MGALGNGWVVDASADEASAEAARTHHTGPRGADFPFSRGLVENTNALMLGHLEDSGSQPREPA